MELDQETKELLAACAFDTGAFGKLVMPETFSSPFGHMHKQILDLIDGPDQFVSIAAPRGLGKTSLCHAKIIKDACYNISSFVVYVSNSATIAEQQTENIKMSMVTNKLLKKFFGPVKAKYIDDADDTFSKRSWVAFGRTFILPRGAGQQIRGLLYKNFRPDLVIFDDLESLEALKNPDLRKALKIWFNGDALKIGSVYNHKKTKVIYIDTVKHEDALLLDLINDTRKWKSVKLSACDENYNTLDPIYISQERLKEELAYHRENNMMDVFAREYQNNPVSLEDRAFKPEYFRYYQEQQLFEEGYRIPETVILVDPAKTAEFHSDESAVVAVGLDTVKHKIYVRDPYHGRIHPDQLYDKIFEMVDFYGAKTVGMEVTSLHEFITQPLRNEMMKRGKFFNLIELNARGKKENRISALIPYYRQGLIYHNGTKEDPGICSALEGQLLSFPNSKLLDIMDCLAYVVELLDFGDRYFEPPESDDDSDFDALEEEYDSLEYDAPLENWRIQGI